MTTLPDAPNVPHSSAWPHEEYTRRLSTAQEAIAVLDRRDMALANARLLVFVVAGLVALVSFWGGWISAWWLALPALAFVVLVWIHGRTARERDRDAHIVAIYERGLARIEDRWIGTGRDGANFSREDHLYAGDLDLFGRGSLFQRISTAVSVTGESTLASWLLAPADAATIRLRQEAVEELILKLDLRQDLIDLAQGMGEPIDLKALTAWCEGSEAIPLPVARPAAVVLGLVGLVAAVGWFFGLDSRLVLAALAVEGLFAFWLMKPCGRILKAIEQRTHDLARLTALLDRIERETFSSPRLVTLKDSLFDAHATASSRIQTLWKRVDLLQWRRNMLFAPVSAVLLWGTQVAMAVEAWRRHSGRQVAGWVAVLGEFEALSSLAAHAFENPDAVFPEIREHGGPSVEALGIGHPLLAASKCVRNDVSLGGELRALVVSGSNMSGKSTLLRAVGTNIVLALAGGKVRATRMSVTPMAIGATLRIQDSLQEGKSRFYAEILRLRQVVDLARGELPLFFLLDEILHGTNSHDRLAGSSSVVRGLIELGAIGFVTTHDLALAEVAERLAPRAANVHFEDHFEDGQMRFDYRMKPGVVRNSNALALMRAVGLEV